MQSGKKIKFDEGLRIAIDVSSALHYMHSRRPFAVIHRDIKPNILLTHGDTAKVADFGLSRMRTPMPRAQEPDGGRGLSVAVPPVDRRRAAHRRRR